MIGILEMTWYSVAFMVGGGWVLSMVVPSDTHPTVGRILGVALVVGSIFIGYLMAFEKSIDIECRPAGSAIYNDC